jgi:hypothetical protein
MSQTPSKNLSPKRLEEINAQPQSAQNSPKQEVTQPPPHQVGQNYGQPVQNLQIINGATQTNVLRQHQQPLQQIQMQMTMQRVPSFGIISPAINSSVGSTPQISPSDNNLQFAPPVQQNHLVTNPGQQVQMHVLQQVPQQNLFQQQQPPQQQHQSQQQQLGQQQQNNIINQKFLGHQTFSLQQQPIMFQQQMIPQQQFQQQSMQQQMYQPQLQHHAAMVQAPMLYAAQPAAVVSNPAPDVASAPTSLNNTPVSKAVKKGRFRVVKPAKQDPIEIGDGQSIVSSTSEAPTDFAATAVTTKKKGRFLVKTTSVPDAPALVPPTEAVADTEKSDSDDAVSKGGGLPPQLPPPDNRAAGANNVKKKGRFRIKSGLNLADVESSLASDKADGHIRKPSEETLQSVPKLSSVSMGDNTVDEGTPSIASNTQLPDTAANAQVPQVPQYTTFVPSMTSYDVNNQVMMVSAPFVTAQNTAMPMMQTSLQQPQMQQMYQNQVQVQQQQQQQQLQQLHHHNHQQQHVSAAQQPVHNAVASSHSLGLSLSNPNSPIPKTEPSQTQPHQVPPLPQQARSNSPIPKRPTTASAQTGTNSGAGSWRGISGSNGKNGRLIGCGGVGKILHNLDSLRQEILDADKSMTSLQSDNRCLRNKNKELEAKISNLEKRLAEEKSLRRTAEAKLQTLRQKVKELQPVNSGDTHSGKEIREKMNEMASSIASDGKQVSNTGEEKQDTDDCDGGQDSKSQKGISLSKVEHEPKPKSPQIIRRTLTGSISDLDMASLAKPRLADMAPTFCPSTSSVGMTQNSHNLQSLVDDNIAAPIPIFVTTQMPISEGENAQHFDPLGTPEKSQPQLNIQSFVVSPMVPSVPTLTHLNGTPAMATVPVPVYTLPMSTIQIPSQQQQCLSKQQEHDPFDDIVCRGHNGEQNGNGYHDSDRHC